MPRIAPEAADERPGEPVPGPGAVGYGPPMHHRWGACGCLVAALLALSGCSSSGGSDVGLTASNQAAPRSTTRATEPPAGPASAKGPPTSPATEPPTTSPPAPLPGRGQPRRRRRGAGRGPGGRHLPSRPRDRRRHAGELHLRRRGRRGGRRRDHHLRLRSRPGHDHAWTATAKIRNDTGPEIVIDGGGKVTLSGGGQRRILYMNTCDAAQVLHHLALPGPGPSPAHRPEPDLRRRQRHRRDDRGRGRRRHLRARRPGQDRRLAASSATAATRPGPTSAAPRCGC